MDEGKKAPFDVVEMVGKPGRFEIVDIETGEIVDNANGYGYKSKTNAYRAGWYKLCGGKQKVDEAVAWWKKPEHREFREFLEDEAFYLAKECGGTEAAIHKKLKEVAIKYAEEHDFGDYKPEYYNRW